MIEPNAIVLYVENLELSSKFYQELLGIEPDKASPTFNSFTLSNGMGLGLKAKYAAQPPADINGGSELAFTLETNKDVDELFATWQKNKIHIIQPLTDMAYGYTFLALDPDGNRLRVVSLNKSMAATV